MKTTRYTRMRTTLLALLGTACLASAPARAGGHYEDGIYIPDGVCVGNCDDASSSSPSSAPSGPSAEEVRQQKEKLRQKAKAWSSDEAQDYVDRKDWDNAIRSFEEALDHDPDDPDLIDGLNRAKAEKAKARMPAMAAPSRPAAVNAGKTVVDTRGVPQAGADLLERVPELRNSPEAGRIRKGYQALLNRDWPVALAWWQDALKRDPANAALKRSVALAQWMVDREKEVRPGPVMLFGAANAAAKNGDFDRALHLLQQLKTGKPAMAAAADRMIEAIQQRRANIQLPEPGDMELLFPSPYAAAITATTKADYSRAIDLLEQIKRDNPAMTVTTDRMIANVRLLSPMQLPEADDMKLIFPERAFAGPMSGSGLELFADGYYKKAQEVFNRLKTAMPKKTR
ncbi:MAG: hypothetical protein PSX71_08520 [bacterium]|nr:hypothetical protein [bacterium]